MADPNTDKPRKRKPLFARPTGAFADPGEIHERVMKRYPKVMARLAEVEREEAAGKG